jgi:hypothetical protein
MSLNAKAWKFTAAALSIVLTAAVMVTISTSLSASAQVRSPSSGIAAKDGAGTGNGGGGGSYVVVDGQWFLSDAFYDDVGEDHSYNELPEPLRKYLDRAEFLLKTYGINGPNFWDNYVRGANVVYTFLSKDEFDRVPCNKYLPPINPGADEHVQMGCTVGNTTYLIASDFKAATLLEQAKTIIHERLWALNSNPNQQRYIARLTTALGQLLKKQDDQLFRNDRSPLTRDELKTFDRLELAARQFGFEVGVNRTVSGASDERFMLKSPLSAQIVRGGGIKFSDEQVDDQSFIGVGTILYGGAQTVIERSTLIGADVWSAEISDSTLIASEVIRARIRNSAIDHSLVLGLSDFGFSEFFYHETPYFSKSVASIQYATISNSKIYSTDIAGSAQKPVVIKESFLHPLNQLATIAAGVRIESSVFNNGEWGPISKYTFKVGSDAEIKSVIYNPKWTDSEHHNVEFAPGVKIKNVTLKPNFEGGYFRKSTAWIRFEGDSLDFDKKSCEFTVYELQVKKAEDLLKLCK